MFFTNMHGLIKELKARTVSRFDLIIYSIFAILPLMPWSVVIHAIRTVTATQPTISMMSWSMIIHVARLIVTTQTTAQSAIQSALQSAWLGTIGQWLIFIFTIILFLHYNRRDGSQDPWTRFVAISWVTHIRIGLISFALGLIAVITVKLGLMLGLISDAVIGRVLFTFAFKYMWIAHLTMPIVYGLVFARMFSTAMLELVRD